MNYNQKLGRPPELSFVQLINQDETNLEVGIEAKSTLAMTFLTGPTAAKGGLRFRVLP